MSGGDGLCTHITYFGFINKSISNTFLLMWSAVNLCKQFGPRSGLTKYLALPGFKLLNTDGMKFYEDVKFE